MSAGHTTNLALSLSDKIALVTGAARGIGAATVAALAAAGATVLAGVRQPEADVPGAALTLPCDVADYAAVLAAVELALARYGRLDVLVNNAGVIAPIGPIAAVDPAEWAANVTVNLMGALHGCRAALPPMIAQRSGTIINISSGAAQRPLEGWSAYCAAKAGLAMLTQSVALEAGPQGVRVYGLRPGVVDTAMQAVVRASGINPVSRLRREELADAREPAALVAWLCTAAATDLAGQELDIRDDALRQRAGLA